VNELTPHARALLDAGRHVHDPTDADRARVRAALRARLDHPSSGPPRAPRAPVRVWFIGGAVGVLVFAIALWIFTSRAPQPTPPPAIAVAPHVATPTPSPAPVAPPAAPAPATIVAATSPPSRPAAPRATNPLPDDGLTREVALLRAARRSLSSGALRAAERSLATHRRTFRNGQLVEERDALAAELECMRTPPRREAFERFAARYPESPYGPRVRRVCTER
jgi:hypothetical protein